MKLVKLSLAAMIAAGALTSVASASSLEEAIKGVELNGYVRYRYTDMTPGDDAHEYKGVFKVNVPVNDAMKLMTKSVVKGVLDGQNGDANPGYTLADVYFQYTGIQNLTVNMGKQGLPGPFTDAADQRGTGIVALYNAGAVTLAAGGFTNSNALSGEGGISVDGSNIYEVAVIGSFAGINARAWYVNVDTSSDTLAIDETVDGYAVILDKAFDLGGTGLNIFGAYANLDKTDIGAGEQEQYRIGATVTVAGIDLTAAYAVSGDEGGDVTFGDEDAAANFYVEQADMAQLTDADAIYVAAGANIVDGVSGKLEYLTFEEDAATGLEGDEIKATLNYKMSENMNFQTYYSILDIDGAADESKKFRFEAKYSF